MNIKYLIMVSLLSGCAAQMTSWTPVVDAQHSQNNANLQNDMIICKDLASRTSPGDEMAGNIIGSTVVGGALGSLAGLAFSAPAQGAIIGSVGALGISGAREAINSDTAYKQAYINCMRGRGHNVIN